MKANAFFLEQPDGWHMVIVFDSGEEMISDKGYSTKDECARAFDQWCIDTNTKIDKVN